MKLTCAFFMALGVCLSVPPVCAQTPGLTDKLLQAIASRDRQIYALEQELADSKNETAALKRRLAAPSPPAEDKEAVGMHSSFQVVGTPARVKVGHFFRFVFLPQQWNPHRKPVMQWTNARNKKTSMRPLKPGLGGNVYAQTFADICVGIGVPARREDNAVFIRQSDMAILIGNAPITPEPEAVVVIDGGN